MDKENCKNLYKRYLELKEKMPKAHIGKIRGCYEVQDFSLRNREELNNTKKELLNCLRVLSDNELMKISEEIDEVGKKVWTILEKRMKNL